MSIALVKAGYRVSITTHGYTNQRADIFPASRGQAMIEIVARLGMSHAIPLVDQSPNLRKKILRIALISILVTITIFKNRDSALSWPAIDNFPGICSALGICDNSNDLLSYAESSKTLRWPYQSLLIIIGRLSGGSPYIPFSLVKAFILLSYPTAVFLLIETFVSRTIDPRLGPQQSNGSKHDPVKNPKRQNDDETSTRNISNQKAIEVVSLFTAFVVSLSICGTGLLGKLSIAWWSSPFFSPAPAVLAQAIVLLSVSITFDKYIRNKTLETCLLGPSVFVATLIHPVACFYALIFALLVTYGHKYALLYQFPVWLAGFASASFFTPSYQNGVNRPSVSNEDFQRIYVDIFHPKHYSVASFGHFTPFDSWIQAALVVAIVGLFLAYAIYRLTRSQAFWKRSAVMLGLYFGSIILQLASNYGLGGKLLAALGPSRFTMYGPLYIGFLISTFMVILASTRKRREVLFIFGGCLTPVLPVMAIAYYLISERKEYRGLTDSQVEVVKWLKANTQKNQMIAVSRASGLSTIVSTHAKRPVMHGHGFPFSEKLFAEHEKRFAINDTIFEYLGDPYIDNWSGYKKGVTLISDGYRSITSNPLNALNLAEKSVGVKWIIGSKSLRRPSCNAKPVFANHEYSVYGISQLIDCDTKE